MINILLRSTAILDEPPPVCCLEVTAKGGEVVRTFGALAVTEV